MNLTIPDERLEGVTVSERDVLIDIAIGLYKRGEVSLGRGGEIARLSVLEFQSELARRRIPINYDLDDLREDILVLNDLPHAREGNADSSGRP
jgi:predicted HTH domain antitoxin